MWKGVWKWKADLQVLRAASLQLVTCAANLDSLRHFEATRFVEAEEDQEKMRVPPSRADGGSANVAGAIQKISRTIFHRSSSKRRYTLGRSKPDVFVVFWILPAIGSPTSSICVLLVAVSVLRHLY